MTPWSSPQRGYALIILMLVLMIGVLYHLLARLDNATETRIEHARITAESLSLAKEALLGYAVTYRDSHPNEVFGYLPCPDTDGDGSANTVDGSGSCGSSNESVIGLLPYRTLGIGDLRDGSGGCLWYAVSGTYKASLTKAEPMNWDTQGQLALDNLSDIAVEPGDVNGGGAAIVIAADAAHGGQNRSNDSTASHLCGVVPGQIAAYLEGGYASPAGGTMRFAAGMPGSASNNDQFLEITPREIFARIKKRRDFVTLVNGLTIQIAAALEKKIKADLIVGTAPGSGTMPSAPTTIPGPVPYAGLVGKVPDVAVDGSYATLLDNWGNQYRYLVCADLCGYCLNIGGQRCDGALLFGAEHTSGGPRAVQPTQAPDMFEMDGTAAGDGKGALALAEGASNSFSGASAYAAGAADVGICLAPMDSKPLTFSCDLGRFDKASPTLSGGANLVTISNQNLTLGQLNVTSSSGYASNDLFGCIWSGETLAFGSGLRSYFSFTLTNTGRGFVFAIIDAAQYPVGSTPCGKSDNYLGYAGDNGTASYPRINPPKIGLEVHTVTSTAQGGPGWRHAALVYWGDNNSAADDDDNKHGASNSTSGNPSNPGVGSKGLSANLGTTASGGNGVLIQGATIHVRIDIVRNYSAGQGSYDIKAWLIKSPSSTQLADLKDLSQDFTNSNSGGLAVTVSDSFTMLNLPASTGSEALQHVRLGFTTGQGSVDQAVTVQNFSARAR